jgi:hypothetical protein
MVISSLLHDSSDHVGPTHARPDTRQGETWRWVDIESMDEYGLFTVSYTTLLITCVRWDMQSANIDLSRFTLIGFSSGTNPWSPTGLCLVGYIDCIYNLCPPTRLCTDTVTPILLNDPAWCMYKVIKSLLHDSAWLEMSICMPHFWHPPPFRCWYNMLTLVLLSFVRWNVHSRFKFFSPL